MGEQSQMELESKLEGLREQFKVQTAEAKNHLEEAAIKIQQLYLGIEVNP